MRHQLGSCVFGLAAVMMMMFLAPSVGHADCVCGSLSFNFWEAGAYDPRPATVTFAQGCNHVSAKIDSEFQAYALGTCNSLGQFGGPCQVNKTVEFSCFVEDSTFFLQEAFTFHCLSCGL
jgi:hypothetical protein